MKNSHLHKVAGNFQIFLFIFIIVLKIIYTYVLLKYLSTVHLRAIHSS